MWRWYRLHSKTVSQVVQQKVANFTKLACDAVTQRKARNASRGMAAYWCNQNISETRKDCHRRRQPYQRSRGRPDGKSFFKQLNLSLEATYHYDILDVLSYKHSRYRQLYERCRSLPTHLDLDYLTPRPIKRPPHHDYLLFSLSLPSGTTDNTNASVPYPDEIKMTSVGWQSKIPLRSITLRKFFCLA